MITPETLSQVRDLGIAIVSVLSVSYLLLVVIKANKEVLDKTIDAHNRNQEWFLDFVNTNNHQKSEMIEEHTKAMVEVKNSIEANTKVIEKLADKL